MQVHWKIQFLGGVHKKPIYRGNCLKGRLGEFADLSGGGGVGEKEGAYVIKPQCILCLKMEMCIAKYGKQNMVNVPTDKRQSKLSDTPKLTLKKNFMPPFYGWGSTSSRLEPLRGGSLVFTTKSESNLEPPSGFEHGTPGLVIQRLNQSLKQSAQQ